MTYLLFQTHRVDGSWRPAGGSPFGGEAAAYAEGERWVAEDPANRVFVVRQARR